MNLKDIKPELIATCAHEAGHYICFVKYDIECGFPKIINPDWHQPGGFVEVDELRKDDPRFLDHLIAGLAGGEAQRRIIRKLDLNCKYYRGCETDQKITRKLRKHSERSYNYIQSKARSRVYKHGSDIDRIMNRLLRKYA